MRIRNWLETKKKEIKEEYDVRPTEFEGLDVSGPKEDFAKSRKSAIALIEGLDYYKNNGNLLSTDGIRVTDLKIAATDNERMYFIRLILGDTSYECLNIWSESDDGSEEKRTWYIENMDSGYSFNALNFHDCVRIVNEQIAILSRKVRRRTIKENKKKHRKIEIRKRKHLKK